MDDDDPDTTLSGLSNKSRDALLAATQEYWTVCRDPVWLIRAAIFARVPVEAIVSAALACVEDAGGSDRALEMVRSWLSGEEVSAHDLLYVVEQLRRSRDAPRARTAIMRLADGVAVEIQTRAGVSKYIGYRGFDLPHGVLYRSEEAITEARDAMAGGRGAERYDLMYDMAGYRLSEVIRTQIPWSLMEASRR